jgi:hypothetical protein
MSEQDEIIQRAEKVARDVAEEATCVARDVAKRASEVAEKVLLFAQDMAYIKTDIKDIKDKLDNKYVTKDEFSTVKAITYGLVTLIMIAVVGGLMTLLITHN